MGKSCGVAALGNSKAFGGALMRGAVRVSAPGGAIGGDDGVAAGAVWDGIELGGRGACRENAHGGVWWGSGESTLGGECEFGGGGGMGG